jgi:hypothetical protein
MKSYATNIRRYKPVSGCAPIGLFVYNRFLHTKKTIEALQKNVLAKESDLFVFSDGPKDTESDATIEKIRQYTRGVEGFRSVTLVEHKTNQGLAVSIVTGVTRLCEEYGRVIVVEDDLVTSPLFLTFINAALDYYSREKRVWHISGWNYPIDARGLQEAFFLRVMNCWGWATWADRWQHFQKDPDQLIREWDEGRIQRFNLDGANNFWDQVIRNYQGSMNTWAIFWYATIFENDGLCLNPTKSYVQNIGHDGSGTHCDDTDEFSSPLSVETIEHMPERLIENREAVARIREFYKSRRPGLATRIRNDFYRYSKQIVAKFRKKVSFQ